MLILLLLSIITVLNCKFIALTLIQLPFIYLGDLTFTQILKIFAYIIVEFLISISHFLL